MNRLKDYIEKLNLQPHPEGGYYRRNWQSAFVGDIRDASSKPTHKSRSLGSSILYFLPSTERCAWHKVACEEMWHHYSGSPLKMYLLHAHKGLESFVLGSDVMKGELPQIVIPANTMFAAEVVEPESYSFCGCSLWPAFTYADFELAEEQRLLDDFPQHKELIKRWFKH
jgi:predicted cupin superfamily sugar epimerase